MKPLISQARCLCLANTYLFVYFKQSAKRAETHQRPETLSKLGDNTYLLTSGEKHFHAWTQPNRGIKSLQLGEIQDNQITWAIHINSKEFGVDVSFSF